MLILDYKKKYHKNIISACARALKQGKIIAYPTDTSYGLAADAINISSVKKLYKIKGRRFNKPVHIVVPSIRYAKTIAHWNQTAEKLAKKFWPRLRQGYGGQAGRLTLVLELKAKGKGYRIISAGTKTIGLRMPNYKIALDLTKRLGHPITATSANLSGEPDNYSAAGIIAQFRKQKYRPDIIINAGKLPKRKPSTVVRVDNKQIEILRPGPISEKEIRKVVSI